MSCKKTAAETAEEFLKVWFCQRNPAAAMQYLGENVSFIGTAVDEAAWDLPGMEAYLRQDCTEEPNPFQFVPIKRTERTVGPGVESVFLLADLRNSRYSWRLRFSVLLRLEETWKINHIHISERSNKQSPGEHYPGTLVMESLMHQRQELLDKSVAGGMMGGYIEPDFPFYFINQRMLEYLGYENEADFVADVEGMISNCMHPDDREIVDREVSRQLAQGDEYTVEYRMRKRDGMYIWVHDVGRRITAEDGRPAIISVCLDVTARRQAQEERERLFNLLPAAVVRCRFEKDLPVLEANDGLYALLGCTREEFAAMGNRIGLVLPEQERENAAAAFRRQLAQGSGTVRFESRVTRRDGKTIWVSMTGRVQDSADEGPVLYGVLSNDTERVEARQRKQEQFARELEYATELAAPNLLTKVIGNLDRDCYEQFEGRALAAAFYKTASFDAGIRYLADTAVSPEDAAALTRMFCRTTLLADYERGVTSHQHQYRRRWEEKVIWCNTTGKTYRNPATGELVLFFYGFDVTDQVISQRTLERVSTIGYDYLADVDMNRGTYRLLARDPGIAIHMSGNFLEENHYVVQNFVSAQDREKVRQALSFANIHRELEKNEPYTFIYQGVGEDPEKPVYKKCSLYYIDRILGRVCLARTDITDVVLQQQRQRATLVTALKGAQQANAAKSDFLSHMSHEIRTPLNAIIGMTALAIDDAGNEKAVAEYLNRIGVSSRFLLALINDILDMSRIESGKLLLREESFSMQDLLTDVSAICRAQAEGKGVDFACAVRPEMDEMYIGDVTKLQQVLMNILSNAVKFTAAGGKVTLSAAVSGRSNGAAMVRFIITDTGIGISPEYHQKIFEPFMQESTGTTAVYGGTGLGLAISKSIVDMMNGHIELRSIQGVGSEFTVEVRLGCPGEDGRPPAPRRRSFRNLRTLVVDDDVDTCQSAVETLRGMDVFAEWVNSGVKAIQRVKAMLEENRHFDIILLDWKMPEMDGMETTRRIRELVGPDVTIIIVTAYGTSAIEKAARAAGADMLLEKPMFRATLAAAFGSLLDGREKPAQSEEKPQSYDFTGRKILLAEDHPLNTEIAVKLLERVGFQVDAAANGLQALELFSRSQTGEYAAILMDIRMPVMDGLAAAANIRRLSNGDAAMIPIIAMTANAFDEDVDKSRSVGMNAHLTKPIEPETLYRTLYTFIDGRKAEENGTATQSDA